MKPLFLTAAIATAVLFINVSETPAQTGYRTNLSRPVPQSLPVVGARNNNVNFNNVQNQTYRYSTFNNPGVYSTYNPAVYPGFYPNYYQNNFYPNYYQNGFYPGFYPSYNPYVYPGYYNPGYFGFPGF